MAEKNITCTRCPMGCALTVTEHDGSLAVTGNTCPRGVEYGRSEFTCPVRTLTSTVRVMGAVEPLLPVRTDRPVPKEKLFECMAVIRDLKVEAPVITHQVLLENIANTGAKLVACTER